MNLIQTMFIIIRNNSNYLKDYTLDFLIKDLDQIRNAQKNDIFAWGLKAYGTHLYKLTALEPHNLLNLELKTFIHDYHKSVDWYLIKVTQSATYPHDSKFYSAPQGTITLTNIDAVINIYNQHTTKPYIPVSYYA